VPTANSYVVNPYSGDACHGGVVTIAEAAKYLFVSRPHVRKLLAAGKLTEVLPRDPTGRINVDIVSVEAYRAARDAAMRAYLDSETEDGDPLEL
jgi:excisionase family DNA binding protein